MKTSMIQKMTAEERQNYMASLDTEQIGMVAAGAVRLALLHEQHTALAVIQRVRDLLPVLSVATISLIVQDIKEFHAPYEEPIEYEGEWLKLAEELNALRDKLRA